MNTQETYLFDLQGYITVPNALSVEQLVTLNAIWDEHIANDIRPDKPNHLSYLETILGKNFRLDHEYADLIRTGKSPIGSMLHGGGTPFDAGQYYHWKDGQMYNGLTVVAYNLRDVHPGDGGFGCVPGSHKANLPYQSE